MFIVQKRFRKEPMRTSMRWIAALAFVGALTVSCTEFDESYKLYEGTMWSGEYVIVDGDQLHSYVDSYVGTIELFFGPGYNQCSVAFHQKGSCLVFAETYDICWSHSHRFSLYSSSSGQPLLCFTGTISGNRMKLQPHSSDGATYTYELVNVSYQL